VSRSGTLTYEVADALAAEGLGVSTIVCLGGDRVVGTPYAETIALFETDPQTHAVVLVGEPGGRLELDALSAAGALTKPLVAYFTGRSAPSLKRLSHAGAITADSNTTAAHKAAAYAAAGYAVAALLPEVAPLVRRTLAASSGSP
jgi:succinyl-CoA synthetase alpha subunit